jgi:heterogeneous nuclear rnp K-like protein 2
MGTIIGRQGSKIKQIQDASGCRMVASKEMLPQSTERVVEIQGNVEAIKHALRQVAECVLEDWERAQGTVPYHPGAAGDQGVLAGGLGAQTVTGPTGGIRRTSLATGPFGLGERRQSRAAPMPGGDRRKSEGGAALLANGVANLNINPFAAPPPVPMSGGAAPFAPGYHPVLSAASATFPLDPLSPATSSTFTPHTGSSLGNHGSSPLANNNNTSPNGNSNGSSTSANLKTQNISIPSDMVGCIIGRAGSKITEIRRLSGSRISIAKNPHDESGERMFTIVGSVEANEKALYLLYSQLEIEKQRRVSAGGVPGGAPGSPGQGGYEHGA